MHWDRPLSYRAGGLHFSVGLGEGSGREPGQAGRERFFTPRLRFKNLEELNALLLETASAPCPASAGPERAEDVFHRLRIGPVKLRLVRIETTVNASHGAINTAGHKGRNFIGQSTLGERSKINPHVRAMPKKGRASPAPSPVGPNRGSLLQSVCPEGERHDVPFIG